MGHEADHTPASC